MRSGTYAVSRLLGIFLKSKEALPQMGSVKTKERVFIFTKKGFTVWDDKSFLFYQNIYRYPFSSRFWLHSSISISFQPSISVEFATWAEESFRSSASTPCQAAIYSRHQPRKSGSVVFFWCGSSQKTYCSTIIYLYTPIRIYIYTYI